MVAQPSVRPARPEVDLSALRSAVWDGTLELHFQPEVCLRTGELVALEALLRWRCAGIGVLEPDEFLPVAHRQGLMPSIDTWVLEAGAAQAASWRAEHGGDRLLWLNVSMAQLVDDGFMYRVQSVLDKHGLPPGELGFEISERVLLRLGDEAMPLLTRLRRLGVAVVVDDFQSYYSALGTIAVLPVDAVKLDHRFVRGPGSADADGRVRAVIEQAHAKGMYVVAEGVETWAESARLIELGCDRAHGFLYSSPQRADRASWLLAQGAGWRGQVSTQDVAAPPPPPAVTRT